MKSDPCETEDAVARKKDLMRLKYYIDSQKNFRKAKLIFNLEDYKAQIKEYKKIAVHVGSGKARNSPLRFLHAHAPTYYVLDYTYMHAYATSMHIDHAIHSLEL